MMAMYITALFVQYIWRDCITLHAPLEKYSAFKLVSLETQNVQIRPVFAYLITYVYGMSST